MCGGDDTHKNERGRLACRPAGQKEMNNNNSREKKLIPDQIPGNVWADIALGMLEAHDLCVIAAASVSTMVFPPGAAFVATRYLTAAELNCLSAHHIPVVLLSEIKVDDNGDRSWFRNGWLHRDDDLPAIERADGERVWVDVARGCYRIRSKNGTVARLKNHIWNSDGDLPALELANGTREWREKGRFHRTCDLPAIEFADGGRQWYIHGKRHRDTGPAVVCADGSCEWWRNGKRVLLD